MGHIPAAATATLAIQPFEAALAEERAAPHDYDAERWLYLPCRYTEYRYILGTRGQNPLICVGINPSTAAPGRLDNTLQSVERIARFNGHDSFLMFNVYAQRATDPRLLDECCDLRLHTENMKAFAHVLGGYKPGCTPTVWAAWGTVVERRPYLAACMRDMVMVARRYGAVWVTAGRRSVKGHPHHPLYLRSDSVTEPFDIEAYLNAL